MSHVDKKPKIENGKENNNTVERMDLQELIRSGKVLQYAAMHETSQRPSSSDSMQSYSNHFQSDDPRAKKPWEYRITEVLALNLKEKKDAADAKKKSAALIKTEGDIPNLCLHSCFFVEGVRIGWPFPVIMPPQRQMALHLIKALKNRRHVVLESPTGTGKSAAILCTVLAWQRHHKKQNANGGTPTPRIIYCSRTHSQVAQMVASLRKTPYRPRMTVLGSRERLCIHQKIRNRGPQAQEEAPQNLNVNQECKCRVGNTEAIRKKMWKSQTNFYDDDNPANDYEMDTNDAPQQREGNDDNDEEEKGAEWIDSNASKKPSTCPHYRQLTARRTADMTYEQLVPREEQVSCCTQGGEHTRFGSHDIEDLVQFAMDPYAKRGVAVYRSSSEPTFGMGITKDKPSEYIKVRTIHEGGAIASEASIQTQDSLLTINGQDTSSLSVQQAAELLRSTEDPLLMDVSSDVMLGADATGYSEHSPCPYYLSRALEPHAELVFAPYQYLLDPSIRKALDVDLTGAICVLDEAHNVEDTLRESGSGKFGEIELCEMMEMLINFAGTSKTDRNIVKTETEEGEMSVGDVAHALVLFVEKLITFLIEAKTRFEQNPGNNGARKVIADWERFHTPDNTEFDMTYDGPTGQGRRGKAVGCQTFFEKLSITQETADTLLKHCEALEGYVRSREGDAEWLRSMYTTLIDNLTSMVQRFTYALEQPSSYFISSVVKANGSLEFASGMTTGGLRRERDNGFKRKPKKMPKVPTPSNGLVDRCFHPECREVKSGPQFQEGGVRHGFYCNGSEQPWEAFLVLELLTPAKFMSPLAEQCHTVVLASGSLSPIMSLCGELGLTKGPSEADVKKARAKRNPIDAELHAKELAMKIPRLQMHPKPLEANHVIDLEKQLLAVSIGHFSDGTPITMTYSHYSKPEFIAKLGDAIASVVEAVPSGGVLMFLPSYSLLKKCVNNWNPSSWQRRWGDNNADGAVWERFLESKGKVIVEPSGSQQKFEEARDEYADTIRETGNCILLAVFRGKMSEGISFNDENARAVICVGIPFPQIKSTAIKAKMDFNTEQRRFNHRNDLLPGNEWYSQQAYRAIAQALGRCIRHAADYGSVVLMDSRHCDDGAPVMDGICNAHRQLPKWMRHHVRNLSRRDHGDGYGRSIAGSWPGLRREMARFFQQAPIRSRQVLEEQNESLQRALARDQAAAVSSTQSQQQTGSTPVSAEITPTPATPASLAR